MILCIVSLKKYDIRCYVAFNMAFSELNIIFYISML